MQHVCTSFHQSHVGGRRVQMLAVGDRVNKAIEELFARSQQVRLDKTQHTVICAHTHACALQHLILACYQSQIIFTECAASCYHLLKFITVKCSYG